MENTSPFFMLIANLFILASYFSKDNGLGLLLIGFCWLIAFVIIRFFENDLDKSKHQLKMLNYKVERLKHEEIISKLNKLIELKQGVKK